MKNLSFVYSILVTASTFYASLGVGQSSVVYFGVNTNSVSVAFADTNLSAIARASIVTDLQLCLQDWGLHTELDLGDYELGLAGYLYNPDRCPHYPEGIDFPRNLTTNQTAGLTLQIPKPLSDAYTNAFAFAAANSNIVAAAYEFVAFVSSTNLVHTPSNSLPNYIIFKNVPSNIVVCGAQTILSSMKQRVYPPSVLGFYYSTEGPSATNLWVRIPQSISSYGGTRAWNVFPSAIWHDGRWKFCVWDRVPGVP